MILSFIMLSKKKKKKIFIFIKFINEQNLKRKSSREIKIELNN